MPRRLVSKVDPETLNTYAKPVEQGHAPEFCGVPDCYWPYFRVNLCLGHYKQLNAWRNAQGLGRIKADYSHLIQIAQAPAPKNKMSTKERHCHVDGCQRPYMARGLCKLHHHRYLRALGATW